MTSRSRSPRYRSSARTLRVGVLIAAATLLLGWAPPASVTDAAWTDSEHTSASVTSIRLSPPQVTAITTCARPSILTPTVLRVQWRWVNAQAPYSQMAGTNALWAVGDAAAQSVPTTGPVDGVYTSTFSGTLLGNLLGGLLGSSYSVSATTQWTTPGGHRWRSPAASTIQVDVPPVLGTPTCTATNGT